MALDTRWKNPQGSSSQQLYLWAQDVIKELRKGDYLPAATSSLDADQIVYDNAASGLTATDAQAAIDEVEGRVDDLEANTGLVLLAQGTVTSAATLDIVLTTFTAFRGIRFSLANFVPATDDVEFWLRVSTDGGSSYDAGASDYRYALNVTSESATGGQGSAADTQIAIAKNNAGTASVSNTAAEGGVSAAIHLLNQTDTGIWPKIMAHSGYVGADGVAYENIVHGVRVAAQDTNAVRFLFESGNIASGKYAVYGMK